MKAASFIAVGLSLAAALVAAGAYYRVRTHGPASPDDLKARIVQLESDLRAANDRLARVEGRGGAGGGPGVRAHESDDLDALRRKVEALERQVASRGFGPPDGGRAARPSPQLVEEVKKRLSNTTQPLRNRAQAIGVLRQQGAHKTDDVIDASMALFAQAASDPGVRALILRNLKGAENPRLADSAVQILKTDPDEDVRDDAARLVGEYQASKPEAKAALEQAAANDTSEKVKRTARTLLAAPPREPMK